MNSAPATVKSCPIPRRLAFVVVKRINPRLRALYGHWWIEVDEQESYGWWPDRRLRIWHWFTGAGGGLNGAGLFRRARPTRDPWHGRIADHSFHPTLHAARTDDEVRAQMRDFAQSYTGGWSWQWPWSRRPTHNCRTFQLALFDAVGIVEDPELLYTHGPGCPVLFPVRQAAWRLWDIYHAGHKVFHRMLIESSSEWWPGVSRFVRSR